jgi:YHS domain-containing protein
MEDDLVCHIQVDSYQAASEGLVSDCQGQLYYFCSRVCKERFDQNPQAYLARQPTRR